MRRTFVILGGFLLGLDNAGLRDRVTPLLGFEYSF